MADINSKKNPLGDLFESLKRYVDLRVDEIKLILAENSARIFSKIVYITLSFILVGIILAILALALSNWLGAMVGSVAGGYMITACIFLILLLIVYLFRNKFFLNSNLRMFLKIFFNDENKSDHEKQ